MSFSPVELATVVAILVVGFLPYVLVRGQREANPSRYRLARMWRWVAVAILAAWGAWQGGHAPVAPSATPTPTPTPFPSPTVQMYRLPTTT